MARKRTVTPESILAKHEPHIQAIARALQEIIKNVAPDAAENGYPGWHAIGYTHPRAGYFCGIFPHKDHVRLALEHGASLPDPDGLLKAPTNTKQVRFVIVDSEDNIPEGAIVALLNEAIWLKS